MTWTTRAAARKPSPRARQCGSVPYTSSLHHYSDRLRRNVGPSTASGSILNKKRGGQDGHRVFFLNP